MPLVGELEHVNCKPGCFSSVMCFSPTFYSDYLRHSTSMRSFNLTPLPYLRLSVQHYSHIELETSKTNNQQPTNHPPPTHQTKPNPCKQTKRMPARKSRKRASRSQKRDLINQAIADTARLASIKRGIALASNKTLFQSQQEAENLEKPKSVQELSQFKKQKRKYISENFKDGLDRLNERVMRPDLTEVCVKASFAPSKSLEQKNLDAMVHELKKQLEQEQKLTTSTTTTTTKTDNNNNSNSSGSSSNNKKRKASTSLISFWDDNQVKKQKQDDEQLLKTSFISDVLVQKGQVTTLKQKAIAKHVKKPLKRAKIHLPLAGQSYNPAPEDLQRALELAHLQEARLALKAEQITESLTVRDEEELAATGNDELDGLLARERPVEQQDPSTIRYPPQTSRNPKAGISKRKSVNKALERLNQKRRERRKQAMEETKKIGHVAQELYSQLSRKEQLAGMKKSIRRERLRLKKQMEELPVKSVMDVQLPEQISGSLRKQQGNSWSLWYDRLGAHHRSSIIQVDSLKKGNIRVNSLVVE